MASTLQPKVYFFFEDVKLSLGNRTGLKKFIISIFKKENHRLATLNYIFCSDKHLLDINRRYLNHDFYTDIITFDLSENQNEIIADIFISTERIRDNARKTNTPISKELYRVMFHGALHLCGYNDKSKSQISIMRRKEDGYLSAYLKK